MNNIKPISGLVLAEVIKKEETKSSGLYLPSADSDRFIRIKVIEVGEEVNKKIKVGLTCIANPMLEIINIANPNVGFINAKDILAIEN